MTATRRRPGSKYMPTYDYSKVDTWSMSGEEADAIMHEATRRLEAGDKKGFFEEARKLPLAPNLALMWRDDVGKEALLAEDCNLADAEIVYGKDWLDTYMVE